MITQFFSNRNLPASFQAIILGIITFLSRLPFIFNGYGTEEDSWGLVLNAFRMREEGAYSFSRMPGHPLHEITLSISPITSPAVFNGLSMLFGLAAVILFYYLLRKYKFKFAFEGALMFAFVPVFYISNTYTIDYAWAIAFVLGSWLALKNDRLIIAGALLGLAVGCRITAGAMALPFMIMLWKGRPKEWLGKVFVLGATSLLVTIVLFLPVWQTYGWEFFGAYKLPSPPLPKVFYKGSFGVFGFLGRAGLIVAAFISLKDRNNITSPFGEKPAVTDRLAWISIVVIFLVAYLSYPEKSAFMIPLLPALVLLSGWCFNRRAFKVALVCMLLSPFLAGFDLTDEYRGARSSPLSISKEISGQEVFFDVLRGPIFNDYSKRQQKDVFVRNVLSSQHLMPEGSLVISEWWYNQIMVYIETGQYAQKLIFMAHASPETLQRLSQMGVEIYYLPELDYFNDRRYGKLFTRQFAKPFLLPLTENQ